MSVQTSYSQSMTRAVAGNIVDANPKRVSTKANTATTLEFGRGVVQDSSNQGNVRLPASGDALADFAGVALLDNKIEAPAAGGVATEYPLNSAMGVLEEGNVWVQTEESVAVGDDVYMRITGRKQIRVITFNADFVASNNINLKIDGVAMTQITYATSHAATIAAVAAQILAQFGSVIGAAVASSGPRTITLTALNTGEAGEFTVSDIAVTAGASQATGVATETQTSVEDSDAGKFRNDSDGSTAVQITTAKWTVNTENSVAGLLLK